MKRTTWLFVCTLFTHILVTPPSWSQKTDSHNKANEPQNEYLIEYLTNFNLFITNPENYSTNSVSLLSFYNRKNSNTIHGFIYSDKKANKFISPSNLVNSIVSNFPDGLGLHYVDKEIVLVNQKQNLLSKTYVYKAPIEYSGIQKDGTFFSYSNNQYFYIKKKFNNNSISRISDKTYYEKKHMKRIYREGLLIEVVMPIVSSSFCYLYYEYDYHERSNRVEYRGNASDFDRTRDYMFFGSGGVNIIYMLRPYFGIGTGLASHTYKTSFNIDFYEYELPTSLGYTSSVFNGELINDMIIKGNNTPIFIRLQTGRKFFSVSLDMGIVVNYKQYFESYLSRDVNVALVNQSTGQTITDPTFGYGSFTYDNTLVSKYKPGIVDGSFFYRFNIHFQPVKYSYLRISSGFNGSRFSYNESLHPYDMYAIRLNRAEEQKNLTNLYVEMALGFNLNEVALTFNNFLNLQK